MKRSFLSLLSRIALVASLVVSGCTCKHGGDDHPSKESPAALKIDPPDDLDLPHSTTPEALPTEAIPIYVSRTHIVVGFDKREVVVLGDRDALKVAGVPAKYQSIDQTIQVVIDAVDAERKARKLGAWIPAVVAVDASIPFHVVGEVLLTVQKAGFDRYSFVVKRDDGSLGGIGLGKGHQPTDTTPPPPASAAASPAKDATIYLGLRVVDDGYMLRAFNRELGPDCTNATFGTTVPKKAGAFDAAGLTSCAQQIRARVPDTHDKFATISVASGVAFSEVVRAIDALRAAPDGKALFPDVGLALVH